MDFHQLFPGLADVIPQIGKTPPFSYIGDLYAPFGAIHLLGMSLLGGCVILTCLRLLGVGLTNEAPSVVERNLRVWHIVGASIVIGTGLVIGGLNAERLYGSQSFFVKMISMTAALTFTFGVVNSILRNDGQVKLPALILGGVATIIFLFGMGVFALAEGTNPGTFHVLTAAYAVLAIFGTRVRWIALIIFALLFGSLIEGYMVAGLDSFSTELKNLGIVRSWLAGILFVLLTGYEIYKADATAGGRVARMIAVMSILAWFATAAGGRWIGFA